MAGVTVDTVVISAVVGVVTSAITAYITAWLKIREERSKWQREFSLKFAELQATDRAHAENLAKQFAVAVLIIADESTPGRQRERIFIAPNSRLVAGNESTSDIVTDRTFTSRKHAAFYADGEHVYVEDLRSTNGTLLNGRQVASGQRHRLKPGDVVQLSPADTITVQMLG